MRCQITRDPDLAAEFLRDGKVVALPTETVYGLAGVATNPEAVARIFAAKQRPEFDPLIVHLADFDDLPLVAACCPPEAQRLMERFWPGPLTVILPRQSTIPGIVTSGLPTVGVRLPNHGLTRDVIRRAGAPVAAPSANLFGRLSPTRPEHVLNQLGDVIDLVLDGGPCTIGVESTIVQFENEAAIVVRPGGLPLEDIRQICPNAIRRVSTESITPSAPGLLPSHYAPRTPIQTCKAVADIPLPASGERWGLLSLTSVESPGYQQMEVLSARGDLIEATARFFETLHQLDHGQLDRIVAVKFPDVGLGVALNDRLMRAAAAFDAHATP